MPTLPGTTSGDLCLVVQLQQHRLLVGDGGFVHKLLGNGGISSKVIHIDRFFLNTFLRRKSRKEYFFKIVLPER